ncbi:MAG: YgiQ family radical SAM protein, partial [Lachnospiraceae bacterium]|nr:YgiQ family radical SAM protein [Lachnospiraceae bacterium]
IAEALDSGLAVKDITFIRGTVYKTRDRDALEDAIVLPDYNLISKDSPAGRRAYAESFAIQHRNTDPFRSSRLAETYDGSLFVIQNLPTLPLTTREMDDVYALPYKRTWHPSYDAAGGVPALGDIKFSLTSNRGCFGDCNFCALTFHEGRIVQARSHASILEEARSFVKEADFRGNIYDVGGPTAEFRAPSCKKQMKVGTCADRRCLFPKPCPNLHVDHSDYLKLLREIRAIPGVKKVFVRSGFRFDYLMADPDRTFLKELCQYHVSGQLRVAPEHISDNVLKRMGKPPVSVYNAFRREFEKINQKLDRKQYLVPYLMSSHPGSTLKDAIALAEYIRELGYMPEQVQDFYPTPGTVSTCMYYTGLDPLTMEKVYVAVNPHEKAMQRALIQYRDPANYDLVKEALIREGREDLIGFGKECLIPPRRMGAREGAPERQDRGKGRPARGRTEGSGKKTEGGRGRSGGRPGQSGRNRKHAENGGRR